MDRKQRQKELQEQFKEYRAPMGLYQVKNMQSGRREVGAAANLPGKFNSLRFQLINGSCPVRELQQDWNTLGETAFEFSIVEELAYDENTPTRSYRNDLKALEELWLESISEEERALLYKK